MFWYDETLILFILLQRESEVGKMGQEVEAYFEELVEKFFPYIDLRAHTPTSVKSEGGKPKPKKIKRKSEEALLHVHWAILFQFIIIWLCIEGWGVFSDIKGVSNVHEKKKIKG